MLYQFWLIQKKCEFPTDSIYGGVFDWYENIKVYEKQVLKDTSSISKRNIELWKLLDSQPIVPDVPIEPNYDNPTITTRTYGPFLNTNWYQGCGYNELCPNATDGPCGHAYTGSVATAMAQILRYNAYPSSYNWSIMPDTYGTTETARLMHDIGISVGMEYGGDGSGIYWRDVCPRVVNSFKTTFGYSSTVRYIDYFLDRDLVKSEIRYHRPVFMRGGEKEYWLGLIPYYGGGHAWVCDGYQETEYVGWCTYLYLHINWGWSGSYNGWYAFDNFNPGGNDYNYKVGCVIGIKP